MMNAQAQASDLYLRTKVNTVLPGELTLMLYNGCIKFMKLALEALRNKNIGDRNLYSKRALDILDELIITLNHQYPISKDLSSLYVFMKDKIVEANLSMDAQGFETALGLLADLKDAWAQALSQIKSSAKTAN